MKSGKSEVYFIPVGASHLNDSILDRLKKLFNRSGAGSIIKENALTAVKLHFGEYGNVSFIPPVYYGVLSEQVKLCGGKPFLTDTNTLYVGNRSNSVDHTINALKNGFSFTTAGAPVVIADGLTGSDYVNVEINMKHVKKAKIASSIYWADSMITVSHAKMHLATSYGGAIKNIGMGCAARGGKQEQHSGNEPLIIKEKCTGCGECVKWCGYGALSVEGRKVKLDSAKCSGCGECISVCRFDALATKWDETNANLQEKMAEYAFAALQNKKGKAFHFVFIINVTPDCDCLPATGRYIVPDIGILASFDPVAADMAAIDLINSKKALETTIKSSDRKYDASFSGRDNFKVVYPQLEWATQLEHAEKIRLGKREYELVEV